jgi:hypothetical protein
MSSHLSVPSVFKRNLGPKRRLGRLACLVALTAALTGGILPQVASAFEPGASLTPSTTKPFQDCPGGACDAISEPPVTKTGSSYQLPFAASALEGGGEKGGYDPKDLQSAYDIPTTGGSTQTVALIDAYGDSTAESDLAKYREKYGLSACTKASGCFKKVNQKGEEGSYPANNEGWSVETSLDLDMVSAACPECHILLVEASGELPAETGASVEKAVDLGATEVSNSYGYPETYKPWCGETGCLPYDADYDFPGVVITASAGDRKYDNEDFGGELSKPAPDFPASSPHVIAVGGTKLTKAANTRGWSETVWNEPAEDIGTGSGCSGTESKPEWQKDGGCAKRTDNDVSADAACESPVSIYSTSTFGGWANECGTSASAPLVAGIEAHASKEARFAAARAFYERPSDTFDVTTGSDGSCSGSYLCTAGAGYDGPTGKGSPDGVPQIFLPAGGSTPAVVRDTSNGNQGVFYTDTAGEIAYWAYSGATGWENADLAGGVRSGTNPAATLDTATGALGVYYVNTSGEIAVWGNTGTWGHATLGGSVRSGTSPTATVDESTGDQAVYYVNTSGEIAYWIYTTATGWVNGALGGSVHTGTSPIVTIEPSTGDEEVYYVNTSNEVAAWGYAGSWVNAALGGSVRAGTNPAVAREFRSGEGVVYYVNTSGEIALRYYEGGWKGATLGGSVHEATSPSVVHDFSAVHVSVDYTTTTNEVGYWVYASGSWSSGALGGETVQPGASPTVIIDQSTGNQWLYYTGEEDSTMWTWNYIGGVLNNTEL